MGVDNNIGMVKAVINGLGGIIADRKWVPTAYRKRWDAMVSGGKIRFTNYGRSNNSG